MNLRDSYSSSLRKKLASLDAIGGRLVTTFSFATLRAMGGLLLAIKRVDCVGDELDLRRLQVLVDRQSQNAPRLLFGDRE